MSRGCTDPKDKSPTGCSKSNPKDPNPYPDRCFFKCIDDYCNSNDLIEENSALLAGESSVASNNNNQNTNEVTPPQSKKFLYIKLKLFYIIICLILFSSWSFKMYHM